MRQTALRPTAPASAREPRNAVVLGSATTSENRPNPADLQARRIAARFRVPADMARVVAALAFGEVRT